MRFFPRTRQREPRTQRNDVQLVRDRSTQQEREVCHGEAWEQRRQEVWARDNGKCQGCGGSVPLHNEKDADDNLLRRAAQIHHRQHRKMGGGSRDDRMDNLQTLCWGCHRRATVRGE